jgi:hypothetical protein
VSSKPAAPLSASLLGVPKGAAAPAQEPVSLPTPEVRQAMTVRLPVTTLERLREAAHRMRQEKQELVDQALVEWLTAKGY